MSDWTNYQGRTSCVDPDVERKTTPAYCAGLLGADAKRRDQIFTFEVAEGRLVLAGLTFWDLFMPRFEFFMARRGLRNTAPSRLCKPGLARGQVSGVRLAAVERGVPAVCQARDANP